MTNLALEEYTREIDGIMGRESYDEAVAHCLHILNHYPKHVETYRQLGKALLEKGQHGDAADVFQRILSAEPNDFVAHVGLAIIREEDDQLDQALWHMERAFELAPSNAAVQAELRRLYNRRDGVEPTRIRLTRGALARQYLQGDLYGPAIAELKAQLASEPDRMDLQVVLAEALWRDQQRVETQERCMVILEKLPNCTRANALLADLRLVDGREEEAAPYLRRWQELAPYEARDRQPVAGGWAPVEQAQPVALELPYLEWSAPLRSEGDLEAPEWVRELGLALGEQQREAPAAPEAPETLPEWLRAGEEPAPAPTGPALHDLAADEHVPDWLRAAEATAQAPVKAEAEEAPLPVADETAPDWLRELSSSAAMGTPAIADDLPEWLRDVSGPAMPEQAEPPAVAAQEIPDWLRQAAPEAPAMPAATGPAEDEDPMAWLERLAAQQGAPLEELPSVTRTQPEQAPAAPAAEPAPASDTFDWMREVQPAAGEELPDWLRAAAEVPSETAPATPPGEGVPPAVVEAGAGTGAGPSMDEDPMAWLERLAAQQGAPLEELPSVTRPPEPQATSADEVPEWLRAVMPAEPAATTQQAEVLPDWLTGAVQSAPTASAAEPARPEDELGEMPEDPEAARVWLEQLMAREGRDAAVAPAGAVTPPPQEAPAPEPAPGAEILAGQGPSADEDPMAWLERLAAQQGAPIEELPSIKQPHVPEPVTPPESAPPAEGALIAGPSIDEDPMAWLERLAAQQGAPLAELPSVQQAPPAASRAAPAIVEVPEVPPVAASVPPQARAEAAPPTSDDLGEMPEDPEAARLWLERLMAREGRDAVVEALPAAAAPPAEEELPDWLRGIEGTPAPEPAAEAEPTGVVEETVAAGPSAGEDPMAWLERLAAQQGAPLEELPSITQPPVVETPAPPVSEPPAVTVPAGEGAPAWRQELAAEQAESPAEPASVQAEAPQAEMPDWLQSALEQPPPVAPLEAAPPADSGATAGGPSEEDAMTWLERLAARQGAPLEELPSVTAPPVPGSGAVDMPAWLSSAIGGTPEPEPPAPERAEPIEIAAISEDNELQVTALPPDEVTEAFDEGEDVVAWLEQLAARQGAPAAELPTLREEAPAPPQPVAVPQPEELRLEEPRAEAPWTPHAVEELHVSTAEVLATTARAAPEAEEPTTLDEGPATPSAPVRDWVRAAEVERPTPTGGAADIEELRARVRTAPKDYDARLALARAVLAGGDTTEALKHYDVLIKASQHLKAVIDDLSPVLEAQPDNAKLRRSLGDAYNHDGQFQKALELFRSALKGLKK